MAILVTGGAGYIGSVVVDDLLRDGYQVVVLDDLSRGHRGAVAPAAEFYEGSTGDLELVRRICTENSVSAVMHFSALAYVGESVERPDLYYANNAFQTMRLLDALIECDVSQFVFSSSCATYGEPRYVPIDEKHPQWPTNPYGWSKLFVEQMLRDYQRAFGLRFVSLRYFNACGATEARGEHHEPETHLIPLVLEAAAGTRPHISIFGTDYPTPDGTAIRDYIHISDLSRAHLLARAYLEQGGPSDCFNLGTQDGNSVLEVVAAARKVTGRDVAVRNEARRPGDPSHLVADAAKATSVLGWKPEFTRIEPIVESAWRWHEANPVGYGDVQGA
ncbi:MAG: UDP-glucose 4-epimerase GalE [Pyrinomonadaceae bacterium]